MTVPLRVLYVARHNSGGNEDEQAITYALRVLGHEVVPVPEFKEISGKKGLGWNQVVLKWGKASPDFVLFHHWHNLQAVRNCPWPTVLWCFDDIESPCPTLEARNARRTRWAMDAADAAWMTFWTDGDWAAKLRQMGHETATWLPQGADERYVGKMSPPAEGRTIPLLFTGMTTGGGRPREEWAAALTARYGDRFVHYRKGAWGKDLKRLIARSEIFLCPDFPLGPEYWSNRIYLGAGFGAFLMAPLPPRKTGTDSRIFLEPEQRRRVPSLPYDPVTECQYYMNRETMFSALDAWLEPSWAGAREAFRESALARTRGEHLYRHRVEALINKVREELR